ncbi:RNA polymerase sigma-70 factor [Alistipes sp. OttesenSCG-928-B03]|nr:RNA polymerase sigma-70 factor [Alistipes sp. OttesenSCG-928-B03]
MEQIIDSNRTVSPEQQFEATFSSHVRGLLAYAREFVPTQEEAEDIVSEVFANFWEKMDTVSAEAVKTYLFRSTRHKALTYLTHLKVRSGYQDRIIKEGHPPEAFDPDFYVIQELQAKIDAAIDKLPPQRRAVFVMNRFEKKSYARIAEELSISPRTVDKHIELAAKSLRHDLADYLHVIMLLGLLG